MTTTSDRLSPTLLTGLSLAVTGALIAVLGNYAGDWARMRDSRKQDETETRMRLDQQEIVYPVIESIQEGLESFGRLEIRVSGETAARPNVILADSVESFIGGSLQRFVSFLETSFPDYDFVARASLYLTRRVLR